MHQPGRTSFGGGDGCFTEKPAGTRIGTTVRAKARTRGQLSGVSPDKQPA